jgi:hypothetical protein
VIDPDVGMLRIVAALMEAGIPVGAAAEAVETILAGGSAAEAEAGIRDAMPELDAALLAAINAERLVLRSERAVRERAEETVERRRPLALPMLDEWIAETPRDPDDQPRPLLPS